MKSVDVSTAQISELHDDGKERKPKHIAVIINKNLYNNFVLNIIHVIQLHGGCAGVKKGQFYYCLFRGLNFVVC